MKKKRILKYLLFTIIGIPTLYLLYILIYLFLWPNAHLSAEQQFENHVIYPIPISVKNISEKYYSHPKLGDGVLSITFDIDTKDLKIILDKRSFKENSAKFLNDGHLEEQKTFLEKGIRYFYPVLKDEFGFEELLTDSSMTKVWYSFHGFIKHKPKKMKK